MDLPLRRCVVAVVANEKGQYLVGERSDVPGAWQLPQGGIEEGETALEAVVRELTEEVGGGEAEVIRQSAGAISYLFPAGLEFRSSLTKRFRGQSQYWFLLRYAKGEGPDLQSADGEFSALGWKTKSEIIAGIAAFKREAYERGFSALNL